MGAEKLLSKLEKYLDKGEKQGAEVRCKRIDALLDKLRKKEKKLKKKLHHESNIHKQKALAIELRIVSLELKKGEKRRKDLQSKCK